MRMLVYQLNHISTDLPGVLINNWLAWIQLFNFEVRHIPGKHHVLPNALSRRPPAETDSTDNKDIDEFIKQALVIRHKVCPVGITDPAEAKRRNGITSENVEAPESSLKQAPLGVNNLPDEGSGPITLNLDSQYLLEYLCVAEYLTSLR